VTLAGKNDTAGTVIHELSDRRTYQDARAHLLSAMQACGFPEVK
jgi:hypothetical protein